MNFLLRRVLGRFGPAGRLADLAIVGGSALRIAQRKGLISDETARRLGANTSPAGANVSVGEMVILALALWRLLRHFTAPKNETIIIDIVE